MGSSAGRSTKRGHGLSLRGCVFAFHGLLRRPRERLTRALEKRDATVLDSWRAAAADTLYVVTDYWVDVLPVADASTDCTIHCVTEFWLREMVRVDAWIDPDAHAHFAPPTPRVPLSYPIDFDPALQSLDEATHFVMLPCSPDNKTEGHVPLWPYVVSHLQAPTQTTSELLKMLKRIIDGSRHTSLNCLQAAIEELLSPADRAAFFDDVLPTIKQLVLDMPFQFRHPIRLLTPIEARSPTTQLQISSESVHLSRSQLLTLMSAMLLAVFPGQTHVEKTDFPWFNVAEMLSAPRSMDDYIELKAHKIRTILEYFLRIVPRFKHTPTIAIDEIVTFTRVAVHPPSTQSSDAGTSDMGALLKSLGRGEGDSSVAMSAVRTETNVLIEDLDAHLQIDFANMYAGGGVMNGGAVQEEIRFILSPELLVACLVFAKLEPHESFVIHGSERFSTYTGYGGTYRFGGSRQDATPLASVVIEAGAVHRQRRQSVVVGIDAISYGGNNVSRQYSWRCVQRDLIKAMAGFAYPDAESLSWPIATGNWGCGVFRGDPELKFVIQWLAASLAGRSSMVYVIFEDGSDLEDKIAALARECAHVATTPLFAEWLLEFLYHVEDDPASFSPQQRDSARRLRMRSYQPQRRPRSVLDRAISFIRTKANSLAIVDVDVDAESSPTTDMVVASPPLAVSPVATVPVQGTEPSPRPVTSPLVRSRLDSAASPAGPKLKQQKLTAWWS